MGVERPVETRHSGKEAVRRPAREQSEIEPVVGGDRIDPHHQAVAAHGAHGAYRAEV
jgi:hypothetical protein